MQVIRCPVLTNLGYLPAWLSHLQVSQAGRQLAQSTPLGSTRPEMSGRADLAGPRPAARGLRASTRAQARALHGYQTATQSATVDISKLEPEGSPAGVAAGPDTGSAAVTGQTTGGWR